MSEPILISLLLWMSLGSLANSALSPDDDLLELSFLSSPHPASNSRPAKAVATIDVPLRNIGNPFIRPSALIAGRADHGPVTTLIPAISQESCPPMKVVATRS